MQQQEKKRLVSLIDLTFLQDNATTADIEKLITKSCSPLGPVAALCIPISCCAWAKPRMAADMHLATVINFPHGQNNQQKCIEECKQAIAEGADEIDAVLPYQQLIEKNLLEVERMLDCYRNASADYTLKVIIESGALNQAQTQQASELCIKHQVDFIKTSTGKIAAGADLASVQTIIKCIKAAGAEQRVGIKISGGVRSIEDAEIYWQELKNNFEQDWLSRKHLRFGASQLLDSLCADD